MQDAKEEVRSRLNIEDVIGEYVQLKRSGRNFKGLSPFSGEKTPSFIVSPDKNIWHDFSSGRGGDIFGFVMEVEGVDFKQALEILARRAGIDIEQISGDGKLAKKKKRLLEANGLAARYYQQSLIKNSRAVDYVFKKRGIDKQTVGDFGIGYAPNSRDALVNFLRKRGFSDYEIKDAGLSNQYGGDLFRERIAIPLMNPSGDVIGFTGRALLNDINGPKYLNTPQTLIYDKGRHVFGLSQAKEAIRKSGHVVIVEGNLDVVSSHQAGVKNVVATAGTALTENHLRALSRLASDIRLSFDNDKAGLAATERAIGIAQTVGVDLRIITLPDGLKDPDEVVKQDPTLWTAAINASEPAIDWVIKQYKLREDMASARGKRNFTNAALAIVRDIKDQVVQDHYLGVIASDADTSKRVMLEKMSDMGNDKKPLRTVKNTTPTKQEVEIVRDPMQDQLLSTALVSPEVRGLFVEINPDIFTGEYRHAVAAYLSSHLDKDLEVVPEELQKYENYVRILLLNLDVDNINWSKENRRATANEVLRQLQSNYQKRLKEKLIQQEMDARESGNDARADELLVEIDKLIKGER